MKCISIEQLSLYLENELSEIEYPFINSHLEICESCRRILNQLKIIDWELEHDKVIIPTQELEKMRISAINSALNRQNENYFTISDLYDLQLNTFKNSVSFVKYLPGINRLDPRPNLKKNLESSMNQLLNKMLKNVGTIL